MTNYTYQTKGGTLPLTALTYVERQVDKDLLQFAVEHESNRVCSILAPRQMGKSSLMARTAKHLSDHGLISVQINLQGLGGVSSEESLWYSLLEDICKQVDEAIKPNLEVDFTSSLDQTWNAKPDKSAAKRFDSFLSEEILPNIQGKKLIIFLDEIQSLIKWELQESFIGYIKAISDKSNQPILRKLNFVLLGVAKPSEFVSSKYVTLNVGEQLEIGYLTGDCQPLQHGLKRITNQPEAVIKIILDWTGGQPFLTQLICSLVAAQEPVNPSLNWENQIRQLVQERIISNWRKPHLQSHLQDIENYLIETTEQEKPEKLAALNHYRTILEQGKIAWDETDNSQWNLLISGLVTKGFTQAGSYLQVANPIYRQVFNQDWLVSVKTRLQQEAGVREKRGGENSQQTRRRGDAETRRMEIPSHISLTPEADKSIDKDFTQAVTQFEPPVYPQKTMTNTNRAAVIANIIAKRRPLAQKILTLEQNLDSLAHALLAIDQHRHDLQGQLQEPQIRERISAIDFSPLRHQISHKQTQLQKLRHRFSRDTLNIGVVGLMGQGKSTLLQSISELTDEEIPALRGGACTAVRSTICHQPGTTYAEVTVHSEESFLQEVITPYYQELGLGTPPSNLNEFSQPLPSFREADATKRSMYEHLQRDYHQNLPQYQYLLLPGIPRQLRQVPKEQIHKYVSQRRNSSGELTSFHHLAVRSVKIFCPFKNPEVGKIALVDVPGLGDTRLGDEELILETLGQEVDLILFVRRPDPLRYGWEKRDTDLYQTAATALPNLKNRSFMILNQVQGVEGNQEGCQKHQATIQEKHIEVVQCQIADCADSQQANQVLNSVLDYLANQITTLDQQQAIAYQNQLQQLQQVISRELDKASQAWIATPTLSNLNEQGKFLTHFNRFWTKITRGLEELLDDLDSAQTLATADIFEQQVEQVIKNCKDNTGLPTEELIIERRFEEGDWQTVYAKYLHEIRNHLTQHFHSMDTGLKQCVEEAKSQVTQVLVEQGNLKNLTGVRGPEFLSQMAQIIPEHLAKLQRAFDNLSNFEMSYKANFHYRIRPQLNNLNPDKTNLRLSSSPTTENKEIKAQEIFTCLETLQGEAVFKCQHALEDLYCEPRQAIFAEVEEFVDQVLRAKEMRDQWQIFLFQEKAKIWPSEFGNNPQTNDQQKWQQLVEQAKAANQLGAVI
ncbi:MAG: hypothetical protein F6K47_22310 [Symploca sp. SIO2E6]|nr:hypothetical protein [Symploca sp. SIO2E6]